MFVLVPGGTSTFREFWKRRNDRKRLWATRLLLLLTIRGLREVPLKQLKTVDHHVFFVVSGFPWGTMQQFKEEAIGAGTFGQIRREIRSRTR